MPAFEQIIADALDILKFDGAVVDTLAELRQKWGDHAKEQDPGALILQCC